MQRSKTWPYRLREKAAHRKDNHEFPAPSQTLASARLIFAFNNLCFESAGTQSSGKYPKLRGLCWWDGKNNQPHQLINFLLSLSDSAAEARTIRCLSGIHFLPRQSGYCNMWRMRWEKEATRNAVLSQLSENTGVLFDNWGACSSKLF